MEPDSVSPIPEDGLKNEATACPSTLFIPLPPCQVCMAPSSGYHFGVLSCEACKSFYRRTMKLKLEYTCLSHEAVNCNLRQVKGAKPPCPACRFKKCVALGMSLDAAKKGRYSHAKRVETARATTQYWLNQQNTTAPFNGKLQVQIKQELPSECDFGDGANRYSCEGIPLNGECSLDVNGLSEVEMTEVTADFSEDLLRDDIRRIFETKLSPDDEDTEDMDKFTNVVGDAYDQKQFVPKLLLSQIPDVMHKYLVEEHCKKKKHPEQKLGITREQHLKVFCETGLDLCGRMETFKFFEQDIQRLLKKAREFCMTIPGFKSLSENDRINIFKATEWEMIIISLYPVHYYEEGIVVLPSLEILPKTIVKIFFTEELVEDSFKICKQLQELYLDKKDNALFATLILCNPSYCVTEEGKNICRILRNFSAKCLVKTLGAHVQGEQFEEAIGIIRKIVEKIPVLSKQHSKDKALLETCLQCKAK